MNILGISGLENAVAFKKAHWPRLDEREYRLSQGHDAAAALVVDGVPVAAAAEERFNRQKHSARFPMAPIGKRALCFWRLKRSSAAAATGTPSTTSAAAASCPWESRYSRSSSRGQ